MCVYVRQASHLPVQLAVLDFLDKTATRGVVSMGSPVGERKPERTCACTARPRARSLRERVVDSSAVRCLSHGFTSRRDEFSHRAKTAAPQLGVCATYVRRRRARRRHTERDPEHCVPVHLAPGMNRGVKHAHPAVLVLARVFLAFYERGRLCLENAREQRRRALEAPVRTARARPRARSCGGRAGAERSAASCGRAEHARAASPRRAPRSRGRGGAQSRRTGLRSWFCGVGAGVREAGRLSCPLTI
jgi:hypothetical protein